MSPSRGAAVSAIAPDRVPLAPAGAGVVERFLKAAASASPLALVQAATRAVVELLGERGSCILLGADGPRVVFATEGPGSVDLRLDLGRYPELSAAIAGRAVVAVEDVHVDPLLAPVRDLLPRRLGAVAVVPLLVGERVLGLLVVQSTEPRAIDPSARAAAGLVGLSAALLLDARVGADLERLLRAPPEPRAAGGWARGAERRLTPIRGVTVSSAAPRRILIAEDDRDQARCLELALEDEGFEVKLVGNGAEAVACARQWRPDLVLLDVCMPIQDGFAAAEELVRDPRTAALPILFLSAADDLLPRVRGLSLDEMDFLRKPYALEELYARIERCMQAARAREALRMKAHLDDLTGLGNLRFLRERLAVEQARLDRYGTPLALVVADVDKLKQINDKHGHVVGSRVLRAIGEALRGEIRDTDLAARYGGDEFVVLLPHTGLDDGLVFANRALARIRGLVVDGVEPSVSMGVAAFGVDVGVTGIEAMLAQADAAAYRAKRLGGGRVCGFDPAIDGDAAGAGEGERH